MFLGEMLIGIDLEGEEPGDDSKCIMYSVGGGSCVYTHLREISAVESSSRHGGFSVFFRTKLVLRPTLPRLAMYDADVGSRRKQGCGS